MEYRIYQESNKSGGFCFKREPLSGRSSLQVSERGIEMPDSGGYKQSSKCPKLVKFHKIPYYYFPSNSNKKNLMEETILKLLKSLDINLIVLARYMRIIPPEFVNLYPNRIINIHHSFLPAFIGARPYHQAYNRGVKIIGATSHFVTEELDKGPIIEQDIIRISHRDSVINLIQKGKDLEKIVLSRSVRLFLENRILTYANKTVIFD